MQKEIVPLLYWSKFLVNPSVSESRNTLVTDLNTIVILFIFLNVFCEDVDSPSLKNAKTNRIKIEQETKKYKPILVTKERYLSINQSNLNHFTKYVLHLISSCWARLVPTEICVNLHFNHSTTTGTSKVNRTSIILVQNQRREERID